MPNKMLRVRDGPGYHHDQAYQKNDIVMTVKGRRYRIVYKKIQYKSIISSSTTVNFTIDTIKPNEPLVEVVQEENRTNVYIQITMPAGEDPGTPDDKQQGRLVYTLNGKNPTATSTLYSGIFEMDENGTYTVKAAYIDRAGNIGKIATLIVTVDITPPKYEVLRTGRTIRMT